MIHPQQQQGSVTITSSDITPAHRPRTAPPTASWESTAALIAQQPGMTCAELAQARSDGNDHGDEQRHQLMRTLQEAVEQQVIHEGPPRPCSITDHTVTTWQPGRRP